MRIKFKAGDPRAGTVVQMDSHRGQELIDSGAAVKVKDDGSDEPVTPDAPVVMTADNPAGDSGTAAAAPKPASKRAHK